MFEEQMAANAFHAYLTADYYALHPASDGTLTEWWTTRAAQWWTEAIVWWTSADAARREAANG